MLVPSADNFGALLRRSRMAAGLTQEELAEAAGLSARGISDLERGVNSRPRQETVRLLLDALNLSPGERRAFETAARVRSSVKVDTQALRAPTNLPIQLSSLVGRSSDIRAVTSMLSEPDVRLLTLTGPGGVGKTRLAVHAAAELLDRFADGVFFVPLAAVHDPAFAPVAVAQALDLQVPGEQPVDEYLQGHLARRHMLLVMDNFEHLLPAAPFLADLLAVCPWVKLLVTSRSALRLSGEHEYAVPMLALPDLLYLEAAEGLLGYAAVELFFQRARAVRPDLGMDPATAAAIAEICVRLDGLPLAIELAAVRVKLLPPTDLVKRLDRPLQLLTGGPRDLPARQQTLRSTIAWSYNLLDASHRRLLCWLSVFAGGWTLQAAERLCDLSSSTAMCDVLDGLTALVECNLVQTITIGAGAARFSMLETVREYAEEQLDDSGEKNAVCELHARLCLELAEDSERRLQSAERADVMGQIVQERDNLRVAMRWAINNGATELGLRIAGNLYWFWDSTGQPREGRNWADAALGMAQAAAYPRPRARALYASGGLAWHLGDFRAAQPRLLEAVRLFRELDDKRSLAQCLQELGALAMAQGERATARPALAEAAALFHDVGDEWNLALTRFVWGDATAPDDRQAAQALYHQSLADFRRLGDTWGAALALTGLGGLAFQAEDYETAFAMFEEGLALRRETGHQWTIAISLASLGQAALRKGSDAQAATFLEESLALFRTREDSERTAWVLHCLGQLAMRSGDITLAVEHFSESLRLREDQGNLVNIAQCFADMAGTAWKTGDSERAVLLAGAAEGLLGRAGARFEPAEQREFEAALAEIREAVDPAKFEKVQAIGRALSVEQAIIHALGRRASDFPLVGEQLLHELPDRGTT
jgi:predicted ATPase/DNA-binding XRE family transcriptional regulator